MNRIYIIIIVVIMAVLCSCSNKKQVLIDENIEKKLYGVWTTDNIYASDTIPNFPFFSFDSISASCTYCDLHEDAMVSFFSKEKKPYMQYWPNCSTHRFATTKHLDTIYLFQYSADTIQPQKAFAFIKLNENSTTQINVSFSNGTSVLYSKLKKEGDAPKNTMWNNEIGFSVWKGYDSIQGIEYQFLFELFGRIQLLELDTKQQSFSITRLGVDDLISNEIHYFIISSDVASSNWAVIDKKPYLLPTLRFEEPKKEFKKFSISPTLEGLKGVFEYKSLNNIDIKLPNGKKISLERVKKKNIFFSEIQEKNKAISFFVDNYTYHLHVIGTTVHCVASSGLSQERLIIGREGSIPCKCFISPLQDYFFFLRDEKEWGVVPINEVYYKINMSDF